MTVALSLWWVIGVSLGLTVAGAIAGMVASEVRR
jgi:hypothetical protein